MTTTASPADNTKDMGYDKPYVPVNHDLHGWTIKELAERNTDFDCTDRSGRLTYRPSQRQYALLQPDGNYLHHDGRLVVVHTYGAAVRTIARQRVEQLDLIRELVTGH